MKHFILAILLTAAASTAFAQSTVSEMELNAAVFQRQSSVGLLTFSVKVDQDLRDLDDHELRQLKVTLVEHIFSSEYLETKTQIGSFGKDTFRVDNDQDYSVTQFELVKTEITGIVPLKHGFKLLLKAHFGVGLTGKQNTVDNGLILTEEEFTALKTAMNCSSCIREGVEDETAGGYTYDRGISVSLQKDRSYFTLYGSQKRSGGYRRLLDEESDSYVLGYRNVYDWEERVVAPIGVEIGHTLAKIPFTIYGSVEKTSFHSRYTIAEQGHEIDFHDSRRTFERDSISDVRFKVGFRLKLNSFNK